MAESKQERNLLKKFASYWILPKRCAVELPEHLTGVLDGIAFAVVVEIDPYALCAAIFDARHPSGQFLLGVIVTVPLRCAVKTDEYIVRGFDQFVREAGTAGRAEDSPAFAKRGIHLFIPPARMAELDDVAAARIELAKNAVQAQRRVTKTGRELKQESSGAVAQQVRDQAEVLDQRIGTREAFDVGDEFIDLDSASKVGPIALAHPAANGSQRRP